MVGETIMNRRNGSTPSPPNGVTKGMAELMHDTMSLAEVQFALFKIDGRDGLKQMLIPGAVLLFAGMVTAGSVPIALLLMAEVLAQGAGLSRAAALSIAALSGFLVAAAVGFAGWSYLRRVVHVFDRSRKELARNITWIKHALIRSAPIESQPTPDR